MGRCGGDVHRWACALRRAVRCTRFAADSTEIGQEFVVRHNEENLNSRPLRCTQQHRQAASNGTDLSFAS